jgi:nucleoside-diphosphate-sugar epimerase
MQVDRSKRSMIAVIFGGHGFIGSHLARHLASTGRHSRIVSADIAPAPRFRSEGVEYIHCDVRAPIDADLVPGVTEIYNLAAVHITPGHRDDEYYWTNLSGALNVTDFARRANVNTLVFTSSISVYGPDEGAKSECSALKPVSSYGRSKFLSEQIHQRWLEESPGTRKLIIIRPAVIFGYQEHGNFTRLANLLDRRTFLYPGRKDTIKACGYVKDLIRSVEFATKLDQNLIVYNFAFDQPLTTEDICDAFCNVANFQRPKWVIPIGLFLIGGWLFECLRRIGIRTSINRERILKLFLSTNVVPKRLQDLQFTRSFDLEGALEDWKSDSSSSRFE